MTNLSSYGWPDPDPGRPSGRACLVTLAIDAAVIFGMVLVIALVLGWRP